MLTYNVMSDFGKLIDLFLDAPVVQNGFPAVEVIGGENDVQVKAVIPGVKRDDLSIMLEDNRLILEGEKKSDYAEEKYLRKERSFGKFRRAIKLPYRVNNSDIEAKLENGVLTVLLKRSEDAKPKRIIVE